MIHFAYEKMRHRLKRVQGRNELLAKAIGLSSELDIFDTTAGLGRDALLFSAMGCKVTLFERHKEVFAILEKSLLKLSKDKQFAPLIARMTLIKGCAIAYLAENDVSPDVIYCDPMFAPKTKKALPKLAMQELKDLVGNDDDAEDLIAIALKRAKKRVVVKRANYSLASPSPAIVFSGRSHRFDVYFVNR